MAKRAALTRIDGDGDTDAGSLIERTYIRMRDDIVEGRRAPGEKLRVQHLTADYGVSAGTLREAITRLANDALVVAESQRGFHVAPIALADLQDLTELRLHIELDALRRSIRDGDAAWRAALQQAYDELSLAERPLRVEWRARWEGLNSRFHEALIAPAASPWTLKVLRVLARHAERYRRYAMAIPGSGRDVHAEHEAIFRHAMAGHDVRAALALEAHVRNTLDLIIEARRGGLDVLPAAGATLPVARRRGDR
ncbi:MAG: GntR family transcriptional regulator [Burkholderiales bacterium]|nr:GntR family transcriptional regulator [Burkholderiales bacterium]